MGPWIRALILTITVAILMNALLKTGALNSIRAYRSTPVHNLTKTRNMHIKSIPMWKGKGNNYAYVVVDDKSKDAAIIDPANPSEVLPELKKLTDKGEINLKQIVNTHHHWDHAGGNEQTLAEYKLPVIGGKDCAHVTETPSHNSTFSLGSIKDGDDRAVFTGDTMFIGGCGRFFEGTAPEMDKALNEVLAGLPDDTKVYPGHEYTKGNVKFAVTVSQSDAVKRLEKFANENEETQGKFTIGDEKKHNVFMRLKDPEIQKATGKSDPIEVMAALREMKNSM